MKKIVVLLLIVVLSININGKTHVYTCSDWALSDWMSAHLALALLEERNRNLLFTLLDNQNNRLVVVMSLSPDDELIMVNASRKPHSFTDENINSIFQSIKNDFAKSDTVLCLVSYEALYLTKEKKDYDYLNQRQLLPFNSYFFQRAVKESGAKTHDEKIKVLKEWIDKVMNQSIRASTDPWKLL